MIPNQTIGTAIFAHNGALLIVEPTFPCRDPPTAWRKLRSNVSKRERAAAVPVCRAGNRGQFCGAASRVASRRSGLRFGESLAARGYGVNKGGLSWKRAVGITNAKRRVSRATGIPWTRSGRQRKVGAMFWKIFK
jgi:hypothetical protein